MLFLLVNFFNIILNFLDRVLFFNLIGFKWSSRIFKLFCVCWSIFFIVNNCELIWLMFSWEIFCVIFDKIMEVVNKFWLIVLCKLCVICLCFCFIIFWFFKIWLFFLDCRFVVIKFIFLESCWILVDILVLLLVIFIDWLFKMWCKLWLIWCLLLLFNKN